MHRRFWIVAGLLVIINVAGLLWIRHELIDTTDPSERPLRVIAKLPQNNIDTTERISIVFDQAVVAESDLDVPLEAPPFIIDPELPGYWKWAEPRRLEFILDEPLPLGRKFTVKPTANLELQANRVVQVDAELDFQTQPLKLVEHRVQSSDRHHVYVELKFNQEVEPKELLDHFQVVDSKSIGESRESNRDPFDRAAAGGGGGGGGGGGLKPITLVSRPSKSIVIRCNRPYSDRLTIRVDGELRGHGGELKLGESVEHSFPIITTFDVMRAVVDKPSLDEIVTIRFFFSARLDPSQKLPSFEFSPKVKKLEKRVSYTGASLIVQGAFECGSRYRATLPRTLLSSSGKSLGKDRNVWFTIPRRRPMVRIAGHRGILSPQGNLQLDLDTVNVGRLNLSVERVHANNLISHLHGQWRRQTSRQLKNKTVILDQVDNRVTSHTIDLREIIDNPTGVFRIKAAATDKVWTSASALITVTDLALTVKRERAGLVVWVTSLGSGKPAAAIKVTSISYNNQELATGLTDQDGIARLPVDNDHPDGKPWLVLAEHNKDVAYLQLDRRPWMLDEVDHSGRDAPTNYDVMVYTDRGVYRPGETMQITGLIRDDAGQTPPAFPLSIRIRRPDGRQFVERTVTPDQDWQGTFQIEVPTSEYSQTGPYRVVVSIPGADKVLGRTHALLETFVPTRLELTTEPTQSRFTLSDPPSIRATARYLFGKPASGLQVAVTGTYFRRKFTSKKFADYQFGTPQQFGRSTISRREHKLDQGGTATIQLPPPPEANPGLWEAVLTVTVTESGGRSISKNVSAHADTCDRHIGLRIAQSTTVPVAKPIAVDWVLQTGDDQRAKPGKIELTVDRIEYSNVRLRTGNRHVWKSVKRVTRILERSITSDESTGVEHLELPSDGKYQIRGVDQESGSVSQIDVYATSQESAALPIAMSRPEHVEIKLDKASYQAGATAKVLIKSPFPGLMLLCLETDHVVHQRVVQLDQNSITIDLPLTTELRGGAFVTATVLRKVDPNDSSWLPHRANGIARLKIDHAIHRLPLSIEVPSTAEPGDSVHIGVKTDAPSEAERPAVVHLWAVDEGILSTTDFRTPDPLRHFFAPRQLAVSTSDVFADLLPDHKRADSIARIGGDEGFEIDSLRRNSVPTKRARPAVVWHRIVKTDSQGRADFEVTLPNRTGKLRWMAVAIDGDRYGSAEQAMSVTSPLIAEASWPRFAAAGDQFRVPVKLFNNSSAVMTVSLDVVTSGPIELRLGPDNVNRQASSAPESKTDFKKKLKPNPVQQYDIVVEPNQPKTVWLHVQALEIGAAEIRVTAATSKGTKPNVVSRTVTHLPIRPAGPLHIESRITRIEAGQPLRLEFPKQFLPDHSHRTVRVSGRASIELKPALDQLIGYPYGCVEQTSSRLYGLLAAADILDVTAGKQETESQSTGLPAKSKIRAEMVRNMIAAGVSRLWSMQTASGGLAYWPGQSRDHPWGTTYAAGALLKAKQQGHPVDKRLIEELSQYLEREFAEQIDDDANMKAHFCRMLAAFGNAKISWMSRLSERIDHLDMGGRADLAAAWYLSGRKDRALDVLKEDPFELPIKVPHIGQRLCSPVQQNADLLTVLLDVNPEHEWVPRLVRLVESSRKDGRWRNTIENATALSALARYQSLNTKPSEFEGTLSIDKESIRFTNKDSLTHTLAQSSATVNITSTGTGTIYVSETIEGTLRDNEVVPFDRKLQVRREWKTAEGKPIDPSKLNVGDLVHVTVSLRSLGVGEIENVAIVDALPAGLEIENSRLATSAKNSSAANNKPDHVEFLDDRAVLFATAKRREQEFHYQLRVTTSGIFRLPPIQASSMYDPECASVHGGGEVTVK